MTRARSQPTDLVDLSDVGEAPDPPGEPERADVREDGRTAEAAGGLRLGRLVPRTLTARLVVAVVVLVALIVASTGAATYVALHRFLSQRLDQQLQETAHSPQVSSLVNGSGVGGGLRGPQSVWVTVLDAQGNVVLTPRGADSLPMQLTPGERSRLAGSRGDAISVTTTDGVSLRATSVVGYRILATQAPVVVLIGLSEEELQDTLRNLLRLELAIGGVGLLLAAGLTIWGMYLGLGPLKRVTRTAQEVTAELAPDGAGLDRRVPETGSTTEVGRLATSFNAMLDTVQHEFNARRESEERMRQFLADASHELRTPLTSIRGYAELARLRSNRRRAAAPIAGVSSPAAGAPAADTEDGDTLARIEAEGMRMSRLVEDLLTVARADERPDDEEAGADHVPVDASEVVVEAVEGVRVAHPRRVVVTDVEPDLRVLGDHDQLMRIVRNLADNAVVHTDPAGTVQVSARRDGSTVVLQVSDQGPGLPAEDAAHVFERFWRADRSRTRVRGGSGLGLAIVAQLVHAHHGEVYFDSTVADGSTATVVLPVADRDVADDDVQTVR